MPEPLKIGLIGAGSFARVHLPAYQNFPEQLKMTAVCDIREDAAGQYAKDVGAKAVYTDVETMLREADIDAVDICTIHDQHSSNALAAAEAGKHILIEKPMGIDIEECREMLAATEKAGITFMVAQCLRFQPDNRVVHRMIQDGEFGDIWAVRSDNFYATAPPRSVAKKEGSPVSGSWWMDGKRSGGGALIAQSTHHLDLFRYYIGDVKRVTAKSWTDHPVWTNGAEESIAATLEFENGAIGHVFSSWTTRAPWNHCYWMMGEFGSAVSRYMPGSIGPEQYMGPVDVSLPKYDSTDKKDRWKGPGFVHLDTSGVDLPTDQPVANEILHFAECVREGKEPISSGKDNLGTMKLVLGIYESANTGKPLDLDSM